MESKLSLGALGASLIHWFKFNGKVSHDFQIIANFLDDDVSAFIPWCQVKIGISTARIFHCLYEHVCFASLLCFRSCVKIGPCSILRFGLLLIQLCFCQSLLLILQFVLIFHWIQDLSGIHVLFVMHQLELISGLCCMICTNIGLTVAVVEFLLWNISHCRWLMCFHGFVLLVLLHLQTAQCSVLILYWMFHQTLPRLLNPLSSLPCPVLYSICIPIITYSKAHAYIIICSKSNKYIIIYHIQL